MPESVKQSGHLIWERNCTGPGTVDSQSSSMINGRHEFNSDGTSYNSEWVGGNFSIGGGKFMIEPAADNRTELAYMHVDCEVHGHMLYIACPTAGVKITVKASEGSSGPKLYNYVTDGGGGEDRFEAADDFTVVFTDALGFFTDLREEDLCTVDNPH